MRYLVIILMGLLAVFGWLRPTPTPRWLSVSAVTLIVILIGLQIFIEVGEQRKERASAVSGILDGRKLLLSSGAKVFPKLEIGDSGAVLVYSGPQGSSLLQIFDDTSLEIWVDDGKLKVSTKIRDKEGRLVAELSANEWMIKPERIWDRNYGKDALEVLDETGDVVLQIRLVEDRIQFAGKFYRADGRAVGIGKMNTPLGTGGVIETTGPEHPFLQLRIARLFKYPSSRHLGEFVTK